MKKKILVVEDEVAIANLIISALETEHYIVDVAYDGIEGYEKINNNDYDLLITDLMMPKLDGKTMVKMIRANFPDLAIIMLTALSEEHDELEGLTLGADDYIAKPFSINILIKRVEAILKRSSHTVEKIVIEDLVIDLDAYAIYLKGEFIDLTVKEFEVIKFLAVNKNRVLSREQIIQAVWGYEYFGDTRNIDTHIKNIRRKLPIDNIKTIKGIGYNFVV